jgi:hypothetical protein
VRSFLRLDQLLEKADILGLGNLDSEDVSFVFIDKQAVEREHQVGEFGCDAICDNRSFSHPAATMVMGLRTASMEATVCLLKWTGNCSTF